MEFIGSQISPTEKEWKKIGGEKEKNEKKKFDFGSSDCGNTCKYC